MASNDNTVKVVDPADLADDGPVVTVASVEKGSLFSFLTGASKEGKEEVKTDDSKHSEKKESESAHHKEVVHDGEGIKSTYDVEEDTSPSVLEQLKRKIHWSGK